MTEVNGIPPANVRKTPADPFSGAGFSFAALRAEFGDSVQRMPDGIKTQNDSTQVTWLGGTVHSDKDPAIRSLDGTKEWIQNGQRHRSEGPAVVKADGSEEWWLHGKKLSDEDAAEMKKKYLDKIATAKRGDVHAPARAAFRKH